MLEKWCGIGMNHFELQQSLYTEQILRRGTAADTDQKPRQRLSSTGK